MVENICARADKIENWLLRLNKTANSGQPRLRPHCERTKEDDNVVKRYLLFGQRCPQQRRDTCCEFCKIRWFLYTFVRWKSDEISCFSNLFNC
jgi:hypothetical protein